MLTRMHPEKKASDQDLWSEASPCVKSDTCLINGEMKCQISLCVGVCVCFFKPLYSNSCLYTRPTDKGTKDLPSNDIQSERMEGKCECQIGCL